MAGNDQVVAWRVTGQTPTTRPSPSGEFIDGWTVSFQTVLGNTGTVFVPASMYTPDQVRQAIAAQARVLDEISTMTG